MSMKVKWKIRDRRRGTQKKREKENTNTNTPGPERANPERAREKKSGGRRKRSKTSGGGKRQKRLNQPTTAKPKPISARAGPNLPKEGSTHGGLVDDNRGKNPVPNEKFVRYSLEGTVVGQTLNGCSNRHELDGMHNQPTSPNTKEYHTCRNRTCLTPYMPDDMNPCCHVYSLSVK
jgi:hypothetical protein